MTNLPWPDLRFRAYPARRSRLHWVVAVYRNRTAMRRGYRDWSRERQRKTIDVQHASAITCAWRVTSYRSGRSRTHDSLGVIHLARDRCRAEVLAHEAAHAALYYFQRRGWDPNDRRLDETFAYAVSDVVAQIAGRLW
jgi:diadenosine tetraphosphatase ApaH/serine/threonine PP2A family protein phosphatase